MAASNDLTTWIDTNLWKALVNITDEGHPMRRLLQSRMRDVEVILRKAGTSPKDFTLHDADHSFRVAELIVELIPADVFSFLSAYELGFLILAAYLHDIGMNPEWDLIAGHVGYLAGFDHPKLNDSQLWEFRRWLHARQGSGFKTPVTNPWEIQELVTYYTRSRHNDWSAAWIRSYFERDLAALYQGWIEDLVSLCKSHHWGFRELSTPEFEPREISKQDLIHRRYLAILLRIADILDNDPERVPNVILRHRAIARSSQVHWERPMYMNLTVSNARQIHIAGYPVSALLQKAIVDTVESIDTELTLCDKLIRLHPLDAHPGRRLPHRWDLEPRTRTSIAASSSFEFIDGAFRPNTAKLLNLLSGKQLYGGVFAAIRELVMNAFDAVQEQMARRQLGDSEYTQEYRRKLAETYWVRLHLQVSDAGAILTCRDNGVGMSKEIIEKFLLVSGEAMSPQLSDLQLACRDHGIPFHRSGEFGIGVLSYFMLADHISFRTMHPQEVNGEPPQGWEFETWGVGSFGELRRRAGIARGTEVTLDLRNEFAENKTFFEETRAYLSDLIQVAPCKFQFTAGLPQSVPLDIPPGWALTGSRLTRDALKGFPYYRQIEELKTSQERQEIERERSVTEAAEGAIVNGLRWFDAETGELSEGIGQYRVLIPFFELADGKSLIYPAGRRHPDEFVGAMFRHSNSWYPSRSLQFSWRGWAIDAKEGKSESMPDAHVPYRFLQEETLLNLPPHFHVGVDLWASEVGRVEVHRRSMHLDPSARETIIRDLNSALARSAEKFLEWAHSPAWEYVNRRALGKHSTDFHEKRWLALWPDGELAFRPLTFPLSAKWETPSEFSAVDVPLWRGKSMANPMELGSRLTWYSKTDVPQKLALLKDPHRSRLCVVWERNPSEADLPCEQGWPVECPPAWKHLLGGDIDKHGSLDAHARGNVLRFLNKDHVLFNLVSGLKIANVSGQRNRYNTETWGLPSEGVLEDRKTAAQWLLETCILERDFQGRYWTFLEEDKPGFLASLWTLLFGPESLETPVLFAQENIIKIISSTSVKYSWLPSGLDDPGDEWLVKTASRLPKRT